MSLLDILIRIRSRIERGSPPNEQAVKQTMVLPTLRALGWDDGDAEIVWPEFSVAPRRVDFALCSPAKRPAVFIEVKQPGQTEQADKQLFEYAFHEGVPIAVLTDGQTWSFYLPSGQGSYDDRRFYKLDLLEREPQEAADKLVRYLDVRRISSNEAVQAAQTDYTSKSRRSQARSAIPEAWKELIDAEDSTLLNLISDAVEKRCGYRPEFDEVAEFLNDLRGIPTVVTTAESPKTSQNNRQLQNPTEREAVWTGSWYSIRGQKSQVRSAKAVVIGILQALASRDGGFLEKCYQHPNNRGTSRTYIGRSPTELYPDRPDLQRQHVELAPTWFLMTNFNNGVKEKIIRMACEVSALRLGHDLEFQL